MNIPFILLSFLAATVYGGVPWIPETGTPSWWMGKHNAYKAHAERYYDSINVLFFGDSLTEGWYTFGNPVFQQYYASLGTANYGISGDRTENVLWRIQNGEVIPQMHPKVCVFLLGTNNIPDNDPPSIARGVEVNIGELRERLPNMKILLLGLLPRQNAGNTTITSAVNDIIKNLDNGSTIRFLDIKPHFYNGGDNFNGELYIDDLLHLSEAGYRKWAEVMDPLFKEMLYA